MALPLFFLYALLLLLATAGAQPRLDPRQQESVYRVLESINGDVSWRVLFPDDLCTSAPHGVICELFDEPHGDYSVHVTELSFGFVSDYSSNPLCTPNSTIHPHLLAPLLHLRKLFFYKCFTGAPVPFPDLSPLNLSIRHLVFIDNPSLLGSITGRLRNMGLRRFILTGSNVSGEIKDVLRDFDDNAEEITLSRNRFSGGLPETMENMKNLKILDLSQNGLNGNLPEAMGGGLTALLKLDLSYNLFSGQIPDTLKAMKELEFLDLSHNRFSHGGVPAFLSAMAGLREVYLSGNSLGGHIPEIWDNLGGIIGIGLSRTGLVGNIPASMGLALRKVSYIGLDNNGLEGPIPSEFGALENLHEINLENNRLRGSLPFEAQVIARMGNKLKLAGNPELCFENTAINGTLLNLKPCSNNLQTFDSPPLVSSSSSSSLLSSSSSSALSVLQQWPCLFMFFIILS